MDITLSRECNLLSLQLISEYYNADYSELKVYYDELLGDTVFLNGLNTQMDNSRQLYAKGLFGRGAIDSVDWFANQRIVMYVLIRLLKPDLAVETGVFYGGTTAFLLNALHRNNKGALISIDLPANQIDVQSVRRHPNVSDSEIIPDGLKTGFIIPPYLKKRWNFIEGDSLEELKRIHDSFTFFSHDSEHSWSFMRTELELAKTKIAQNGTIMADDIDWSNAFMAFCVSNELYPLFLTDNGKNNLKVRLGLVRLDHPNNSKSEITK